MGASPGIGQQLRPRAAESSKRQLDQQAAGTQTLAAQGSLDSSVPQAGQSEGVETPAALTTSAPPAQPGKGSSCDLPALGSAPDPARHEDWSAI